MVKSLNDTVTLNNGVEMPWFGLGVFKVEDGNQVVDAVKAAIRNGYRSIDTAAVYKNETGVGKAIKESGVKREDLFITSKVWNTDQGYDKALAAFDASLNRLGLDYLDLYLIHWPGPNTETFKDTWRALEKLYKDGKVRAIGVSNFYIQHLEELLKDAEIVPAVNQVEFHPKLTLVELRQYAKEKGIQIEAWSPLMQGKLLDHDVLKDMAARYNKSVAQVILRWDLQSGVVTIPKSINEERIKQNADIFDFELSREDMEKIDALNNNERVGSNPETMTVGFE
ncbi:aldo/keto reductase [Bacillus altitudinis]|uniref:aldo/keto reductase n=1 Tax=Bacillus pumilus TaxID=1408 RepID=UPI0025A194F9|nr:aldo/keto reductase [Bacillus pumilus]MDM5321451.1 aldo/keto reductase [Bacillus pumilus]MDR4995101.1 aldo/keto reductase [Bacillus altitudinis]